LSVNAIGYDEAVRIFQQRLDTAPKCPDCGHGYRVAEQCEVTAQLKAYTSFDDDQMQFRLQADVVCGCESGGHLKRTVALITQRVTVTHDVTETLDNAVLSIQRIFADGNSTIMCGAIQWSDKGY